MRTARLLGRSQDGTSLLIATDTGEELAIAIDDRLRAVLREDSPRLGQLEIEMESALSPRDIQMRIRAGESLEDVARIAGIPHDRVERFAAPVLAEREHIAAQALASTVRRRGETAGHRTLRVIMTERLLTRGLDVDSLAWDSYRLDDGRWAVTAAYKVDDSDRKALFHYDVRSRFSVAGNDEGRWVLGEQSPTRGPQPTRRVLDGAYADADTEPTIDLNDELAIVRAVQEPPPASVPQAPSAVQDPGSEQEAQLATVAPLRPLEAVPDLPREPEGDTEEPPADQEPAGDARSSAADEATPVHAEPATAEQRRESESPLDTLYGMLGGDGYAEDSVNVYAGLSDGSAVPESVVQRGAGWEPAIVVDYPVEPSLQGEDAEVIEDETHRVGGTDEPTPTVPYTAMEDREDEADALFEEPTPSAPPTPKPRRKRASVPSWDEIMFGGPPRKQ